MQQSWETFLNSELVTKVEGMGKETVWGVLGRGFGGEERMLRWGPKFTGVLKDPLDHYLSWGQHELLSVHCWGVKMERLLQEADSGG